MDRMFRVGIIGASAERGWAKISHVPAVQALEGLTLTAVVGSDQRSADAAARAFGAERGYGDAADLFRDPSIDLVTIAVKVPDHRELVLAGAAAGKHLYCEWPLGRNLVEAEELAAAARTAGVHAAIGLQTRMNPAARRACDLIASGAIGRVLNARIVSTTIAFGPKEEPAMAFGEDAANGATLVTIQGAHTIDFAIAVLGRFSEAGGMITTQYPQVTIGDDAIQQARTTPDHILVQARLATGPAVSIEVAGGRPSDATPFHFEATGDEGSLVLDGGAPRGFQSGRLRLLLNGEEQQVDEGELAGVPDEAANVAGVYAALRDDIFNGNFTVPDFDHAVRLTRLVDDMLTSSATGTRKPARNWPGEA
jgi:predicted dehydrogenase